MENTMQKSTVRKIGLSMLLTLVSSCTVSHSEINKGVITSFGLLEPTNVQNDQQAPETAAGVIHTAAGMKLLRSTNRVPRIRGTTFGYLFVVEGTKAGSKLNATVTVIHPPIQRPGGASATEQDSWAQTIIVGSPSAAAWHFDEEWEMVPGQWTIKVTSGPWLLAEKSFVIE
jgi:hypothetical protein